MLIPISGSDYKEYIEGKSRRFEELKRLSNNNILVYCEYQYQYIARISDKLQFQILKPSGTEFSFIPDKPGLYKL